MRMEQTRLRVLRLREEQRLKHNHLLYTRRNAIVAPNNLIQANVLTNVLDKSRSAINNSGEKKKFNIKMPLCERPGRIHDQLNKRLEKMWQRARKKQMTDKRNSNPFISMSGDQRDIKASNDTKIRSPMDDLLGKNAQLRAENKLSNNKTFYAWQT